MRADPVRLAAVPAVRRGDEAYVARVDLASTDLRSATGIEVTDRFREVINAFAVPPGRTPPGFRVETTVNPDGVLSVDLVRDLSRDADNALRPTPFLFSVDSANPDDIEPCVPFVANLTCNPGIVYDLFLNNPRANRDRRFASFDEVLVEICRLLGPGCDISVELHDPFGKDLDEILDEVRHYESITGRHRLVVKVPHTGPVDRGNVSRLLDGPGLLERRYDGGSIAGQLRGHRLALELRNRGYRVNFTLMFEPYQTALALQARPYFINAFIRNRLGASRVMHGLIAAYEATDEILFVEQLRDYLVDNDYLGLNDRSMDLLRVLDQARTHLHNRGWSGRGDDGLDHARAALRWLSTSNLPDTRLILCSMDGDRMFPDIMRMLTEREFLDLHNRVLLTTDPAYLARWASSPQVVSYQRRFTRAVREPAPAS
ncbi:transaldolase family protein [Rhizomonospora bruguierae]|uniref:transaldolase family protein n=1 Tax=Rhizomonospora bruguierae TaxID=1581705 RepID=UPI001BCDBD7E|nr:transaldolase family protein [Micromonospora sp. NBRC 107566]